MAVGYRHRQQQRLGFLCSQRLADRLESFAKKSELSLTDVIRFAVERYLDGVES